MWNIKEIFNEQFIKSLFEYPDDTSYAMKCPYWKNSTNSNESTGDSNE